MPSLTAAPAWSNCSSSRSTRPRRSSGRWSRCGPAPAGFLDDVPVEDVGRFEEEFLGTLGRKHPGVYQSISETGELSDDTTTALKDAIEDFRRGFEITGGGLLVPDEPAEPLGEDEVGRRR